MPWPVGTRVREGFRVAVVTVNYNTRELTARLLYSLYSNFGPALLGSVVVVDNGSDDGSVELLSPLAERGLITLLRNESNLYHGPGLTQGVNWLASHAPDVDLVWILDSDCVILRSDAGVAIERAWRAGADVLGDPDDPDDVGSLCLNSLVIDPVHIWQPGIGPFREDGDPARHLIAAARDRELHLVAFPFRSRGYVLHVGRATLAQVVERQEVDNTYYEWALAHRQPHWGGNADGASLWATFDREFGQAITDLTGETLRAVLSSY